MFWRFLQSLGRFVSLCCKPIPGIREVVEVPVVLGAYLLTAAGVIINPDWIRDYLPASLGGRASILLAGTCVLIFVAGVKNQWKLDSSKTLAKLTFRIDPEIAQVAVHSRHEEPQASPQYYFLVNLGLIFENSDEHKLAVRKVRVFLKKRRFKFLESDIPLTTLSITAMYKGETETITGNIAIQARDISRCVMYRMYLAMPSGVERELGDNHYLKLLVGAMNQEDLTMDLEIADWEAAVKGTYSALHATN